MDALANPHRWDTLTIDELADHAWELAGEHGTSLGLILDNEWPWEKPVLEGEREPRTISAPQMLELTFALGRRAIAEGCSAADVLRAWADGLPS